MNPSELRIIREIAEHQLRPSSVQKALSAVGAPFEKAVNAIEKIPVLKKLPEWVHQGVDKALRLSVSAGSRTYSDASVLDEYKKLHGITTLEQILGSPIENRDQVADRFNVSNAMMIGAEGFLLGAGTSICVGVPGAQLLLPAFVAADIAASMTLLSRHASQVAASYGYSPTDPKHLPHVIASMVPYADHREEGGFFAVKGGVITEVRAASSFLARSASLAGPELLNKVKAPLLVRMVQRVATRLEITLTQKELGMLIPLAGAGLNGAVNIAFQQTGHLCYKDYFRRLVLAEKYGDEAVQEALFKALEEMRGST